MTIEYHKKRKMLDKTKARLQDEVVSFIGSKSETRGLVDNKAAKGMTHLFGDQIAKDFGETLETLKRNPAQYSMVYRDGGLRNRSIWQIQEIGRTKDMPRTELEVYGEFDNFMNYCETFLVPPSYSLFVIFIGGKSQDDFQKELYRLEQNNPFVYDALIMCRETLRGMLESQAVDGVIPANVFMHINKTQYGAVEKSEVQNTNVSDLHIRDEREIAQFNEQVEILPE